MSTTVSRTFRIRTSAQAAAEVARGLAGVLSAEARGQGARLHVDYDLRITDYGQLQDKLTERGYPPPAGRVERLRGRWHRFKDENMRANLQHSPTCCSKPPPGARRR